MPNAALFWQPDVDTLRLLLPEWALVGTIVALLLGALAFGRSAKRAAVIAVLGAALAAMAAAAQFTGAVVPGSFELFAPPAADAPGMLVSDGLGRFFRVFLMAFLLATIAMWFWFESRRARHGEEFFTLLLASALGMALMTVSVNLLMIAIAVELASIPSYALVGFDRDRRSAAEAALKYAIFGTVTAGLLLFGISLLYGLLGTLHVPTLIARLASAEAATHASPLLAIALLAIFAGLAFKISAVPFHFWCPDAFEGASLPIATWLSVASKAAGLLLLVRLVGLAATPADAQYQQQVLPLLAFGIGAFAAVTCTYANLAAYRQTNVRRLLAYSSIAHAGYMLCAGAVVFPLAGANESAALGALIAYLLVYFVMNFGAFTALGLVAEDTGREDLEAFNGLGWRAPGIAAALSVCLFSLIGLPPLAGFLAKWWLIAALGQSASEGSLTGVSNLLWGLVIVIALNTAVSVYYYARILRQMFLRTAPERPTRPVMPPAGQMALYVCAAVLLYAGTVGVGPVRRLADAVAGQTAATASVSKARTPAGAVMADAALADPNDGLAGVRPAAKNRAASH